VSWVILFLFPRLILPDCEGDMSNAEENHHTTEQRPGALAAEEISQVPSAEELVESGNLADTEEDAEDVEDFDLSDLSAVLTELESSDGESSDAANLITLLGKLLSTNQERLDFSNPGAVLEDAQTSDEPLVDLPPPSPPSPRPSTRPDAANEFIITSIMRGLGPRLPANLGATQPTVPNVLVHTDGTSEWERLGKLSYLRGLFKQWQEAEEKIRKEQDLDSKIRKAVLQFETYFRANGAEALEDFGPLLELIRKANGNGGYGSVSSGCSP